MSIIWTHESYVVVHICFSEVCKLKQRVGLQQESGDFPVWLKHVGALDSKHQQKQEDEKCKISHRDKKGQIRLDRPQQTKTDVMERWLN